MKTAGAASKLHLIAVTDMLCFCYTVFILSIGKDMPLLTQIRHQLQNICIVNYRICTKYLENFNSLP